MENNVIQTDKLGETLNKYEQLLRGLLQYSTLLNATGDLLYKYIKILEKDVALPADTKLAELNVNKMIRVECSELVKKLGLPCGELYIKNIELKMARFYVYIYIDYEEHSGKTDSVKIAVNAPRLADILTLYIFNRELNFMDNLINAVNKHVEKEAKWLEVFKEILALIELVLKNEGKV